MINWYARRAYEPEIKQRFHTTACARLRRLATALGFPPGSFDLRSNAGGIAVSGEITLHHDHLYVQVCQPGDRSRFRHPDPHLSGSWCRLSARSLATATITPPAAPAVAVHA